MKKIFLFLFILPFHLFSQGFSPDKIVGEWVKTDIRLKDGSAIYSPSVKEATFRYIFKPSAKLTLVYNGRTINTAYEMRGNRLTLGNDTAFTVEKLTDTQLVLQEDSTTENPLKIILEPAKLLNIGFEPETYITKGNDTIYVAKRGVLEPFFVNATQNIMEFVFSNFDYPESGKGKFLVRFIITDRGELKAVKVLESSEEKYNDRLIKAIKKSAGKWQPAIWEGRPINTETQLYFDMTPLTTVGNAGGTTSKTTEEKNALSNDYFLTGTAYFEEKKYRQALEYLNKSIELNPYNINAYYNRAATFMVYKQRDAACKDFRTLAQLQQKKGVDLYKKYCNNN